MLTNFYEKRIILLDFDGVIADSFQLAYEINKLICPQLTKNMHRKRFEGNINDWKESIDIHTKECRHDIDFFTEYVPRMKKEVLIVPGMKKIIRELEKSYTLIVISSTITSPIQEFLEGHKLADRFAWIMGNDVHQSKVEKIQMVFQEYGVTAKNCVFITDTLGDMREAEKMKVGTIGITWGFHTQETLQRGKPFQLVAKPYDLLNAVANYFKAVNR